MWTVPPHEFAPEGWLWTDRPRMIDFLLEGFKPNVAGARDLDRILEKKLLQPLATFLLDFDSGKTVEISNGEDFFENRSFRDKTFATLCETSTFFALAQ